MQAENPKTNYETVKCLSCDAIQEIEYARFNHVVIFTQI